MEQLVSYKEGNSNLKGYFVPPVGRSKAPGVLIGHTWLGIDEGVKKRAHRLADLGYAVLIADIFGQDVKPGPPSKPRDVVGPFMQDRGLLRRRMNAGLQTLLSMDHCRSQDVAVIGYCFGGCAALELARSGAAFKGAVSFHGELDTPIPAKPGEIKPKLLVLHGDADPVVPFPRVNGFLEEMRAAKANFEFSIYSGAKHSFTGEGAIGASTPEAGLDPQADQRSWNAMLGFLDEIFSQHERVNQ